MLHNYYGLIGNSVVQHGEETFMKDRDYDRELKELKTDIKNIIGEEELNRMNEFVNLSFQLDEKPKYEISNKIVK